MGLDERAAVANNNKADLFVSLHANASPRPGTAGAEVFYLSLDEYGDAAERAAHADSDSLPVFGGGSRDIELILWDMAQARYIKESSALAQSVEASLRQRVPMSARAIQQAPFRVLVGANMPAVLVEMGFITNPAQEKQLQSDDFQNLIVQALVESISRFRDAHSGGGHGRCAMISPDGDRVSWCWLSWRWSGRCPVLCRSCPCDAPLHPRHRQQTLHPLRSEKSTPPCTTSPRTVFRCQACSGRSPSPTTSPTRPAGSSKPSLATRPRRMPLQSPRAHRFAPCSSVIAAKSSPRAVRFERNTLADVRGDLRPTRSSMP